MNKGGNRVQIPLVLLVIQCKNEQIKNLGKIDLKKRQGKHQIPFECQRGYGTYGLRLRWVWVQPQKVCIEYNALPDEWSQLRGTKAERRQRREMSTQLAKTNPDHTGGN